MPKKATAKQDQPVVVHFTKEQKKMLQEAAAKRAMSLGSLLKSSALERVAAQPI